MNFPQQHKFLPDKFFEQRKIETLIENRSAYSTDNAELNIYETHEVTEKVYLKFNDFVFVSMIEGKKIMHLKDENNFSFLPGESLILPSDEPMLIDFPDAKMNKPTRCLAMTISEDQINKSIGIMNTHLQKADHSEWNKFDYSFRFSNDIAIFKLMKKMMFLFMEDNPLKEYFLDSALQELIIRVVQANSKKLILENSVKNNINSRITNVVNYIQNNLNRRLTIEELCNEACMSESNFHKVFKNEMGQSPIDFILSERIKIAKALLTDPNKKIGDIYWDCGFENRAYFNRVFKKYTNQSPSAYQKSFK